MAVERPPGWRVDRGSRALGTLALGAKLALRGHQKSRCLVHSDEQPYCDDPQRIWRWNRPDPGVDHGLEVSFLAPCRQCEKCLRFRQMRWRERALREIASAKRTWFGTLTFDPTHLAGVFAEAKSGGLSLDEAAYVHVQKYLKRVRKAVPSRLRYFAVWELGEANGRGHYHLLLHEHGPYPVTKRVLEHQWRSFSHWRLVDGQNDGAASYVTKYATKSAKTRIRASAGYGSTRMPPRRGGTGAKEKQGDPGPKNGAGRAETNTLRPTRGSLA